jgi:hypothetical protein
MIKSAEFLREHPSRLWAVIAFTTCSLAVAPLAFSQQSAAATAAEATGGIAATPTTRILAIGHLTAKASGSALKPILHREVSETVRLYLNGQIEQWYFKPDDSAVVFILNLTDPKQAHDLLAQLPLGRAGLMEFDFVRLAPLQPLGMLLAEPVR